MVYPPAATAFFLERAVELGAHLYSDIAVERLGRGCAWLADGSVLKGGKLINAAGQSAARLTPGIPVRPRKGHLVITDRYPNLVRHQLVELGYLKSAHSHDERFRGVQYPAAEDGATAHRLFAAI